MTRFRRLWWSLLAQGGAAALFGLFALLAPLFAVRLTIIAFGLWLAVQGVLQMLDGLAVRRQHADWGWPVGTGALALVAGLLAIFSADAVGQVVGLLLAAGVIAFGIGELTQAASPRTPGLVRIPLAVVGGLALLFGLVMLISGWKATLAGLTAFVGFWALLLGSALALVGYLLRRLDRAVTGPPTLEAERVERLG